MVEDVYAGMLSSRLVGGLLIMRKVIGSDWKLGLIT